jgi:hypothetical protein
MCLGSIRWVGCGSDRSGFIGGDEGREEDPAVAVEAVGRAHLIRVARAVVGGEQGQISSLKLRREGKGEASHHSTAMFWGIERES